MNIMQIALSTPLYIARKYTHSATGILYLFRDSEPVDSSMSDWGSAIEDNANVNLLTEINRLDGNI